MLNKIFSLLILLSLCVVLPVWAKNQSGALTFTPMFGQQMFEGNQSLKTTDIWSVGLGYNLNESWAVEGFYSCTNSDADARDTSTTDTKVETYHLDVLYHFMTDRKLIPYVAAGMGAIYSSPAAGADRDHLLFNYGAGFKYYILDDLIAFRADIRHLIDIPEPDNNLQYSVGFTFQLGRPAR